LENSKLGKLSKKKKKKTSTNSSLTSDSSGGLSKNLCSFFVETNFKEPFDSNFEVPRKIWS
jgi:hypothetical protein